MVSFNKRIVIIGCCGAGKSTLAKILGEKLDLPVIHLDTYYWQPGWQETEENDWLTIQQELIKNSCWIIDGNYINTMDIRLAVADTIIWLDFNRYLCLWRVLKRYLQYSGKTRPDMATGCLERFNWEFLQYVWNFNQIHRPTILEQIAKYRGNQQIIILQKPHQALDLRSGINT
ncbi:topology modulation protein [Chondrocystis sp. NIES-4102]|nr:topology modulation protein [Chondrocystis sp. NIES-4102]